MALFTEQLAQLADYLATRGHTLATAESCTGGLLAGALTSVAGASTWYEGGFVTYRLSAKQHLLGIHQDTLQTFGAVSEVVATQMANHALSHCHAQLAIATTGLAGPDGDGTPTAVGTLWIAWAGRAGSRRTEPGAWVEAQAFSIHAERGEFRERAVELAISGLLERLM
jgi:nicotinamide-nucleotide amidase